MESISCEKDTILVLYPEKGPLIEKNMLEKLLPYIVHVSSLDNPLEDKNILITTEEGISCPSSLTKIVINACNKYITENLIVTQVVETGPAIHHRPLFFGEKDCIIEVRFTVLGEKNSFETVLNHLQKLYPIEKKDDNSEILKLIQERLDLGMDKYGHGVRVKEDTRKWGCDNDSWLEMELQEVLDGMIYTAAAIIRLQRNSRVKDLKL